MAKTSKQIGSKRNRSESKSSKNHENRIDKVTTMDKKGDDFERTQSEPNVSSSTRKKAKFPQPVLIKVESKDNLNEESDGVQDAVHEAAGQPQENVNENVNVPEVLS